MLKALEVLRRLRPASRTLQRPRQAELRRGMDRVDLQRLLEDRDGLVELLHILVADALEIKGVRVPGVELHRLLEAGQRRLQLVARVLGQAQVVPGLGIVLLQCESRMQRLLGLVQLLQGQ